MGLESLKEYCTPESMPEAMRLLDRYRDAALIMAGGSFVRGLDARGLLSGIEAVVDLRALGLDGIEVSTEGIRIGATTRFASLEQSDELRSQPWAAAARDALGRPPLQIRNAATIGGALATSCPFFDVPVALMALDARVSTQGPQGVRSFELEKLFAGMFQNALAPGEFITGILLPRPTLPSASAFQKIGGNANDLAIVNASAAVSLDGNGRFGDVRVVLGGGVGDKPVRASSAEAALRGSKPDEALLLRAAQQALKDIDPMSDHRGSAAYRATIAKVLVQRVLTNAVERLHTNKG